MALERVILAGPAQVLLEPSQCPGPATGMVRKRMVFSRKGDQRDGLSVCCERRCQSFGLFDRHPFIRLAMLDEQWGVDQFGPINRRAGFLQGRIAFRPDPEHRKEKRLIFNQTEQIGYAAHDDRRLDVVHTGQRLLFQ